MAAIVFKTAARVTGMASGWRRRQQVLVGFLFLLLAASAPGQTRSPQVIQVVMDDNYPPFVFKDDGGRLQGMLLDQWQLWEKKTGIHAEIHALDWGEALRRMKAGEFDVIDTAFQTPERADWLDFTKAYARIEVPIFFRKDIAGIADVNSLKGFAVGAKQGDATADLLAQQGVYNLLRFNNYEHIITAAKERKVNVFVVDEPPAVYFLNKLGIAEDFRRSAPVNVGEFHRAVKKGNAALLATVENGFALISPDELAAIDKKWRGTVTDSPAGLKQLGYAALGGLALLLLLTAWNWSLNRQVRRRVAALKRSEAALSKSGEQIQHIIDNTRDAIFQIDLQGNYIFGNAAAERVTGYPLAQLLQMNLWQLVPPEHHPLLKDRLRRRLTGATMEKNFEFEIQHRDGHRVWLELATSGVYTPEGKLQAIQGVARDITERKAYEDQLAQSVSLLRATIEASANGLLVVDLQGKVTICNHHFLDMWGIPAELAAQAEAARFRQFVGEQLQEPEAFRRCVQEISQQPEREFHDTLQLKDGRIIDLESRPQRLDDKIIGCVWSFHDITRQQQAEKSMRLQSAALAATANVVVITDPQGNIEWANPAFSHTTGYTLAEAQGRNPRDLVKSGKQSKEFFQTLWETILAGTVWHGELINRRKDGSYYLEDMTITSLHDQQNRITHFVAIKQDITQRRRMEEELLESEQRQQQIAAALQVAVWLRDTNTKKILYVNPAFERISGRSCENFQQQPHWLFLECVHPEDRERVRQAWEASFHGRQFDVEHRIVRADGSVRWVRGRMFPVRNDAGEIYRTAATVEDITERVMAEQAQHHLEAQLRQSQKMEAIGQLSGGIAHDFNNILTVIQGNASLLQCLDMQPEEIRECADQIAHAGERAAGLTRQLLMFARKQQVQPVDLNLNETVTQMTKLLQRILGEDTTLRSEYFPALPRIHADPGMIEQIILNLAVNARDAMPGGGKLTIRTRLEKLKPAESAQTSPPPHVCLSVTDTGSGIAPEILPRIFEPFFTTKEVGQGTGLGLATVYGIVQQHHGEITVQSEPGQGTTFNVYFPAIGAPEAGTQTSPAQPVLPWGDETILLVEDELSLRTFVGDLLQRCGYTVLEAESGPAALKIWSDQRDHIQLVLTDIIMPENLNGIELGRRLRVEKPSLKVIYTSGYTGNLEGHHTTLIEGVNFIRKPFKPEAITKIIRKNLDGKTNRRPEVVEN